MDDDLRKLIARPMRQKLSLAQIEDGILIGQGEGRFYLIPLLDPERYIELTLEELMSLRQRIETAIPRDLIFVGASRAEEKVFIRIQNLDRARVYVFSTILPSCLFARPSNIIKAIDKTIEGADRPAQPERSST